MHSFQNSTPSSNPPASIPSPSEFVGSVLDLHSNMPSRIERSLRKENSRAVWFFGLIAALALFLVVQGKVSGGPAVSVLLLVMAIGVTLIKGSEHT